MSPLSIDDIGRVRRITFSAPERRNPLSFDVSRRLLESLEQAASSPGVGAIVITGTGSSFCSGGDQNDFRAAAGKSPSEVLESYPPIEVFRLARNYRKPLIAAVNGAAMGGGMGLTCLSHIAIASQSATFGIPEVRLGIFPLTVVPVVRPILGERLTYDLSLTGRMMSSQEALSAGLVSRVVPDEQLQDEALRIAAAIGEFSPLALKLGIQGLQASADMGFEEALQYMNTLRTIFFATEDMNEGATAFLEKRKPVWRGR